MKLAISSEDSDVVQVAVSGNITQDQLAVHSDALRDLLGSDVYTRKVLLDMKATKFLDSSGVSWLLINHKRFKDNNGRMILHSVPPVVLNVLKVLRMHLVFEVAKDKAEALKLIQGDAS